MMNGMLAVATAAALIGGGAMAVHASRATLPPTPAGYYDEGDRPAQRLIIGLDLSKSNPVIDDPEFAAKVGARIAEMVRQLGFASEVHVRTFGTFDAGSNPFYYDTLISARARPEAVAAQIERLVSGTPTLVANGRWKAQGRTNILAFLDNASRSMGCSGLPTTIVLATDGIEDSQFARLDDPDEHLPPPDGRPFSGCSELMILGIGEGTRSPVKTARIRAEWMRWSRAAGFARFEGLNDW
jgi:hypothetical protein